MRRAREQESERTLGPAYVGKRTPLRSSSPGRRRWGAPTRPGWNTSFFDNVPGPGYSFTINTGQCAPWRTWVLTEPITKLPKPPCPLLPMTIRLQVPSA